MHVAHSSETYIDDCEHREWGTAKVAERYDGKVITKEVFDNDNPAGTIVSHDPLAGMNVKLPVKLVAPL